MARMYNNEPYHNNIDLNTSAHQTEEAFHPVGRVKGGNSVRQSSDRGVHAIESTNSSDLMIGNQSNRYNHKKKKKNPHSPNYSMFPIKYYAHHLRRGSQVRQSAGGRNGSVPGQTPAMINFITEVYEECQAKSLHSSVSKRKKDRLNPGNLTMLISGSNSSNIQRNSKIRLPRPHAVNQSLPPSFQLAAPTETSDEQTIQYPMAPAQPAFQFPTEPSSFMGSQANVSILNDGKKLQSEPNEDFFLQSSKKQAIMEKMMLDQYAGRLIQSSLKKKREGLRSRLKDLADSVPRDNVMASRQSAKSAGSQSRNQMRIELVMPSSPLKVKMNFSSVKKHRTLFESHLPPRQRGCGKDGTYTYLNDAF